MSDDLAKTNTNPEFIRKHGKRLMRLRRARARLIKAFDRRRPSRPEFEHAADLVASRERFDIRAGKHRISYITFAGLRKIWRRLFPKEYQ